MASRVPFALLAAVQILAVAAWLALATGSFFPGARSRFSILIASGGTCLAVAEALTGSLGRATSPGTTNLRAVGAVVLALGLARGVPRARDPVAKTLAAASGETAPVLAVAPIAMATGGGSITGLALLVATGCTGFGVLRAGRRDQLRAPRRGHRSPGSLLLSGGLLFAAVAALLAVAVRPGDESDVHLPEVVLVLRGIGALLMLGWVARVATTSLLAKVVSSIMAGLVLASVVVAAVVGTLVNDRLGNQQTTQVSAVAAAETKSLRALTQTTILLATTLAASPTESAAATNALALTSLGTGQENLAIEVKLRNGKPVLTQTYVSKGVDRAQLLSLATSGPVVAALNTRGGLTPAESANLQVLEGATPAVVLATVATPPTTDPTRRPAYVRIYGIVVDHQLLQTSNNNPDFNTTLVDLGSGQVAGSSLDAPEAADIAADTRVRKAVIDPPDLGANVAELSSGSEATLGLATLKTGPDSAALLVVSASSAVVSGTQKTLLQVLFISLLASAVLVAVLALLVGARIVEPVRTLTTAAERVRRGDLAVTTGGSGRDEVGRLSRAFDAMTRSLAKADTDLRASVVQETAVRSRLETVLESIADGLVVVGAAGKIESVNPAAEALLGPAGTIVGTPLAEAVRGIPLESRLAEGLLMATGGRRVPVIVSAEELADGSGRVLVLRDTSREREVERMKTEFLSNVSHELRTPLTPIRGYAGILVGRELPPEKVAHYANIVLTSAQRLTRVVDLLVEVAALDAGRVTPVPDRVELSPFVDERLAAWRTRAPERAADLRRRIPAGLPDAFVDARWLAKAVDELLDNAVKFSPGGSLITLAAGVSDDGSGSDVRVRLEVRDAGQGIPENRRDKLFVDFEQVDGSATRARDGLGLGLPFVRRVADVVGLELTVSSTPGRGSVFTLQVPAAAPKAPETPLRRRRTHRGSSTAGRGNSA